MCSVTNLQPPTRTSPMVTAAAAPVLPLSSSSLESLLKTMPSSSSIQQQPLIVASHAGAAAIPTLTNSLSRFASSVALHNEDYRFEKVVPNHHNKPNKRRRLNMRTPKEDDTAVMPDVHKSTTKSTTNNSVKMILPLQPRSDNAAMLSFLAARQHLQQVLARRLQRQMLEQRHQQQQQQRHLPVPSLSSSSAHVVKKRTVRFATHAQVTYRHVTAKDLEQSWYTNEDYRNFVQDIRETIRWYRNSHVSSSINESNRNPTTSTTSILHARIGSQQKDVSYCLRGIEEHVMQGSFQYKKMKLLSNIRMILKEHQLHKQQQQQHSLKMPHLQHQQADALRMISLVCSRESRLRALELAAMDAAERLY